MRRIEGSMIWGVLLIGAGALLLLQNLGWLGALSTLIWAALFAVGGLALLAAVWLDRQNWWAAIPGFALLGISGAAVFDTFAPVGFGDLNGALFLGALSLGFWTVYLRRQDQWWAIIPGGVLLTLAAEAGLPRGFDRGGLFFIGLAVTFGLVYLLPKPQGRMNWALIPAVITFLLGLLSMTSLRLVGTLIWPVVLIGIGIYLLYRTFRPTSPTDSPQPPTPPALMQEGASGTEVR